jgi:hypothetical protein
MAVVTIGISRYRRPKSWKYIFTDLPVNSTHSKIEREATARMADPVANPYLRRLRIKRSIMRLIVGANALSKDFPNAST